MEMINLYRSITAGFLISIASMIYANCQNHILGALLFSLSLIAIIRYDAVIYTGSIGCCHFKLSDIIAIILVLIGNIVGCCFSFLFPNNSYDIITQKLSMSVWQIMSGSILCGVLVFIAIVLYYDCKNMFPTIMCVMAFILAGGEGSITNICYLFNARIFTLESLKFIILVIIGNAIGATICKVLLSECANEVKNSGKKI